MSDNETRPPVACTLNEEQKEMRSDEVRRTLLSHFVGAEELDNGYTLRFERTDETLLAAAVFIAKESKGCGFAEYSLTLSPPFEELHLTITGPTGTKDQFEDLLRRLESENA